MDYVLDYITPSQGVFLLDQARSRNARKVLDLINAFHSEPKEAFESYSEVAYNKTKKPISFDKSMLALMALQGGGNSKLKRKIIAVDFMKNRGKNG